MEDCVAQAAGILLHGVADGGSADVSGEVADDIGLLRGDDEAEAVSAGGQHALDQVLGNCAWVLIAVIQARAHWKKFFRKGERLNAGAASGSWNHSPAAHQAASSNSSNCSAR